MNFLMYHLEPFGEALGMLSHLLLQSIGRDVAPFIYLIGVRLWQCITGEGEDPVVLILGQLIIHFCPIDKVEEVL